MYKFFRIMNTDCTGIWIFSPHRFNILEVCLRVIEGILLL